MCLLGQFTLFIFITEGGYLWSENRFCYGDHYLAVTVTVEELFNLMKKV